MSHLARGAWIETKPNLEYSNRSPGRTSQEVRGLKREIVFGWGSGNPSHLARGAWIETGQLTKTKYGSWSHLARGAWIETSRPG